MVPRTVLLAALPLLAVPESSPGTDTQGRSSSAASPTVLVLPLENASRDENLGWLGERLAELTVERLAEEGRMIFLRGEARQRLSVLDGKAPNGDEP